MNIAQQPVIDWTINAGNIGSALTIVAALSIQAIKLYTLIRRHDEILGDHASLLRRHEEALAHIPPAIETISRHERAIENHGASIGSMGVGLGRIEARCDAMHARGSGD